MGLFKQMKDMKATVAATPDMIGQAQQLAANAQAMAVAQHAAAAQSLATYSAASSAAPTVGTPNESAFEPVAGVSLALYAEISRDLASVGYDQSKATDLAAARGVNASDWQTAVTGWNARIRTSPGVAQKFNALYTGR